VAVIHRSPQKRRRPSKGRKRGLYRSARRKEKKKTRCKIKKKEKHNGGGGKWELVRGVSAGAGFVFRRNTAREEKEGGGGRVLVPVLALKRRDWEDWGSEEKSTRDIEVCRPTSFIVDKGGGENGRRNGEREKKEIGFIDRPRRGKMGGGIGSDEKRKADVFSFEG